MLSSCNTLPEAIYAMPFPPYEELKRCIYIHVFPGTPWYESSCEHFAFLGQEDSQVYKSLKAIFESKADPEVVKLEGQKLSGYHNDLRDSPAPECAPLAEMRAAYYIYKAWLANGPLGKVFYAQNVSYFNAMTQMVELPIHKGWHGIGDWHLRSDPVPDPAWGH